MKSIRQVSLEIARREGKKKQVNIAQISEIIGILSDLAWESYLNQDPSLQDLIMTLGEKRAKARGRKKCKKE